MDALLFVQGHGPSAPGAPPAGHEELDHAAHAAAMQETEQQVQAVVR